MLFALKKLLCHFNLFGKQTLTLYGLLRFSSLILKFGQGNIKSTKLAKMCLLGFLSGYYTKKYFNFYKWRDCILLLSKCVVLTSDKIMPSKYKLPNSSE